MHGLKRWSKPVLAGCAGVLAALGVSGGLTQAASTTPTATTTTAPARSAAGSKKVTCKVTLVATRASSRSAENFGTLSCSAPLGKGVQHDNARITGTSSTAGAFDDGSLKLFFDTGTLRGTYKTSFTVADKTVTYDGTLKVSSGTGAFRGVSGTGTITGTSTDAVHSKLTDKLTLKIPAKKKT